MKKKIATMAAAVVMVILAAVSLMACGGNAAAGTYAYSAKFADLFPTGGAAYGEMAMTVTLKLEKDDKFTMSAAITNAPESMQGMVDSMTASLKQEGTYKIDGEKITLTVKEEPLEGTFKDGIITLSQDGMKMEFKK